MTQPQQRQPDFQKVAVNLQQRFAEKVANYEGEIAMLQEQAQSAVDELQAEVERLQAENAELSSSKKK